MSVCWVFYGVLSLLTKFQLSLASILEDVKTSKRNKGGEESHTQKYNHNTATYSSHEGLSIELDPTQDAAQQFINNIQQYAELIENDDSIDSDTQESDDTANFMKY